MEKIFTEEIISKAYFLECLFYPEDVYTRYHLISDISTRNIWYERHFFEDDFLKGIPACISEPYLIWKRSAAPGNNCSLSLLISSKFFLP